MFIDNLYIEVYIITYMHANSTYAQSNDMPQYVYVHTINLTKLMVKIAQKHQILLHNTYVSNVYTRKVCQPDVLPNFFSSISFLICLERFITT